MTPEQKYDNYMSKHEDLAEMVGHYNASGVTSGFVDNVLRNLRQYGDLTPPQHQGIMKGIPRAIEAAAKREEREHTEALRRDALAAAGITMLEGRREIAGEVATTKLVDNQYGATLKMMVIDDDGFKYWGSVPSAITVDRGDRVTLTATVEASEDDPLFGFFKRPAKASVTHKEAQDG